MQTGSTNSSGEHGGFASSLSHIFFTLFTIMKGQFFERFLKISSQFVNMIYTTVAECASRLAMLCAALQLVCLNDCLALAGGCVSQSQSVQFSSSLSSLDVDLACLLLPFSYSFLGWPKLDSHRKADRRRGHALHGGGGVSRVRGSVKIELTFRMWGGFDCCAARRLHFFIITADCMKITIPGMTLELK